ncbi:MAG TPA: dihydrolipoamide acetyltransferase family protein [Anaerolineales bacterium]|nr:dihydrolipoamide acetyltransferase family protein [Anaerolineales bacterium]
MATVINMPKLGFDMAEGRLIRWVKAQDEAVQKGEVLAEIETDKATVEVESQESGVVRVHLVAENSLVPVGSPIAILGTADEAIDVEALVGKSGPARPAAAKPASPQAETVGLRAGAGMQTAAGATALPAGPHEMEAEGDGNLPAGLRATPVARRLARERGLDLKSLSGSGPQGRILKSDVESALTGSAAATQRVQLSKLRAIIGRRMTASKQSLPHFYLTADLDAGPLMALRADLNSRMPQDQQFSVNDFLVKSAALALREFPSLNASLEGEEIVRHGQINIGVAVAMDEGLLTVVAREADQKPLSTLSAELRQVVARAREGRVRPADIEGSTFTVSNLGMFQLDQFTAIINPPEAAILAVGSVRQEPVVVDGQITIGRRMRVTLSADHRVTDGAEAARWLQVYRSYVEHPVHLLV